MELQGEWGELERRAPARGRATFVAAVVVVLGITAGMSWASANAVSSAGGSSALPASAAVGTQAVVLSGPVPSVNVYGVTFTESGLPAGAQWWVNFTQGGSATSTGTSLRVDAPNGVYTYTVGSALSDFAAKHGRVVVRNSVVSKSVRFSLVTYKVSVLETGLPAGSKWCVAMTDGATHCSRAKSVAFREPNGTMAYGLDTEAHGYTAQSGSLTVSGTSASVPVRFVKVVVLCPMCG